jgi:hypothetical protein
MGTKRTAKIDFKAGEITKTVNILQRGIVSVQYLSTRKDRQVKQTYLEGTTATVTWDNSTEHNVVSELEYETVSGELRTVVIRSTERQIECPNAKSGVKYRTRSGFVPPDMVDTLYKDWTMSTYPFINLRTGTYYVDPTSYCYVAETGTPVDPLPQPEYSRSNIITIECIEEGKYRISDLYGGYFYPGRIGFDDRYACWGIFNYDGYNGSKFQLSEFKMDVWGIGFLKIEVEIQSTGLLFDTYCSNNVYHMILGNELSQPEPGDRVPDSDGYLVVNNLPFREQGKYEVNAVKWTKGNISGWGEKFGVLAYKVTVPNSGTLRVVDHASADYLCFLLCTDKETADMGEYTYAAPVDGIMEYEVMPGTYYVFGILNTWYPYVDALATIDYDIEIICE